LLLHEAITLRFIAGAALMLAGVAFVQFGHLLFKDQKQ
jgi:drug/metabolite transporter (DMT)-like permease